MSDAAVGSISHILKTAFKDVYEEPNKRERAKEARLVRDAAAAAAADAAAVAEPGDGEATSEEKREVPEEEIYMPPLERLAVAENLKSYLQEQHVSIDQELEDKISSAKSLAEYLKERKQEAYTLEEIEEEELKRQGVMLGQHIPSLPSKLAVDPQYLQEFGGYSKNLVVAKELVEQNKQNTLRRTGNFPISDVAEQIKTQRMKKSAAGGANVPHYVYATGNALVRKQRVQDRFAAIRRAKELDDEEKSRRLAASGVAPAPERKRFKKKQVLTGGERLANEEILKGMQHKLNYLRNPRNIPQALNRLLTKNEASVMAGAGGLAAAADDAGAESPLALQQGSSLVEQSSSSVSPSSRKNQSHSHISEAASRRAKFGETPEVTVPLFAADPPFLGFNEYSVGNEYRLSVAFRNVSAVSRMVRVLPPSSEFFSLGPLTYPKNSKAGLCASGMSVTAMLSFFPKTLGDYEDSLQVETEGGVFTVPIVARREAPRLSLSPVIDIGACLVGDAMRVSVKCTNSGGSGSFRIVSAEDYPNNVDGYDWESMGCLRMPPMTVYPVEFGLHRGDSVELNIEFLPLAVGDFSQGFYLLCDNTQVFSYTIRACAKVLNMHVIEVNNVPFDSSNALMRRDLFFEAANLGIEQMQQIVVVNDTGIPVEFEWVFVESGTAEKNLHKAGQNRIKEREFASRRAALDSAPDQQQHQAGVAVAAPSSPFKGGKKPSTAVRNGFEAAPLSAPHSRLGTGRSEFPPMETLLDSLSSTQRDPRNSVVEREFEISPARGVMPSDGAEPFSFSFTAAALSMATLKAVLMVRGVPMAALPGPAQGSLLSRLQHEGHGESVRLLSWLNEMGITGRVDKYYKPNGMSAVTAQLNNLQSVVGLVLGHASGYVEVSEILRIERVVRALLQHLDGFLTDELNESLLGEMDEDGNPVAPEGQLVVKFYKWNGDVHKEPELLPLLNLTKALSQGEERPGSASEEQTGMGEEKVNFAADFADEGDSHQQPAAVQFQPFSPREKQLLPEIFLDPETILLLLGPFIAEVLDDKVKHEAVDFVRELEHLNVAILSLIVSGEGKPQEILISPPLLRAPGEVPLGLTWTGQFVFSNPSSAMAELELCLDKIKVFGVPPAAPKGGVLLLPPAPAQYGRKRTRSQDGFTFDDEAIDEVVAAPAASLPLLPAIDPSQFLVEFEPSRILLMPESESMVEVRVTPFLCGDYSLVVPCKASTSDARVDGVTIALRAVGPRLRFERPEVDLGLIGVRSSSTSTFCFKNDSPIPAVFSFVAEVEPDPEQEKYERELGLESVGGKSRATPSAALPVSARSDTDSEPNSALVTVSPPNGSVGPGETIVAEITCKAGKLPQRLRGTLECRVFDGSGAVEQATQFQSFRGEIQAPKTIMYPMSFDLGVVFVGMPVSFSVSTENICNLPTNFKLSRPGGDSPSFSLVFDKPSGPLGAKEKVVTRATFTALLPGKIDEVIANKIFGVLVPLGFSLKALAKPLQVDFPLLLDGCLPPAPLAPSTATQFPGNGLPPEPAAVEPLDFSEVPLYDRRIRRFVIRNLSAIPASFEIRVKKFAVKDHAVTSAALYEVQEAMEMAAAAREKPSRGTASRGTNKGGSGSPTAQSRKGTANSSSPTSRAGTAPGLQPQQQGVEQPWLKPREEGPNKFRSVDGKKHTGASMERQENRLFLTSGLGASYLVEPPSGILPPWGVVVVAVRTFNDMPSSYDDELEVSLVDVNQTSKRASIPLKMTVEGCPLAIEDNSLGMTTVARDKSVPLSVWQQSRPDKLLQLGTACVNAEPLVREFRVRNNGSMAAKVAWKVRSLQGKINGPLKLQLAVVPATQGSDDVSAGGGSKVKTSLLFWSDVAKETPFRVTPESSTIKPFGSSAFVVTMYKTDQLGAEEAQLVGNVFFDPNGTTGLATNPSGLSIATNDLPDKSIAVSIDTPSIASTLLPAESVQPPSYRLNLLLQGKLVAPSISIDRRVLVAAPEGITTLPDSMGIKFKAEATTLFSRRGPGGAKARAATVSKTIPLVNPTDAAIVVSVSTQGPFSLALQGAAADDAALSSAKPLPAQASVVSMSQTLPSSQGAGLGKMRTAFGSDSIGRTLTLMPKASAAFTLTFNPSRSLRDSLSMTRGAGAHAAGTAPSEHGSLVLAFSTGQRIDLPLTALVASPFLVGSSPKLFFGVVNVGFDSEGTLLLSNPTTVPARWKVEAVPGVGRSLRTSAIKVPGFEVPEEEMDDPSAFIITPSAGEVAGPTVSVVAATATLPKDYNRSEDLEPVVPQRLSETSWSTSTLSFGDTVAKRHQEQHKTASDACYPQPVKVRFAPTTKGLYSSRFRFSCDFGNSFDVLLQGRGTFEEMEHAPLRPEPDNNN